MPNAPEGAATIHQFQPKLLKLTHLVLGFHSYWFCLFQHFSAFRIFATWGEKYDNIYATPELREHQRKSIVSTSHILGAAERRALSTAEEKSNHIWYEPVCEHMSTALTGKTKRQIQKLCENTRKIISESVLNRKKKRIIVTTQAVITHDCFSATKHSIASLC